MDSSILSLEASFLLERSSRPHLTQTLFGYIIGKFPVWANNSLRSTIMFLPTDFYISRMCHLLCFVKQYSTFPRKEPDLSSWAARRAVKAGPCLKLLSYFPRIVLHFFSIHRGYARRKLLPICFRIEQDPLPNLHRPKSEPL